MFVCVCGWVVTLIPNWVLASKIHTSFLSFPLSSSYTRLFTAILYGMGKQKKRCDASNLSDLATLTTTVPNESDICGCLKARYEQRQQFTWMGSKQLVVLKEPHTMSMDNEHQMGLDYVADYKDTTSRQQEDKLMQRPPHIFELVNRAYFHMRRTGIDQVVTLW